jgi:hypothetical protein
MVSATLLAKRKIKITTKYAHLITVDDDKAKGNADHDPIGCN